MASRLTLLLLSMATRSIHLLLISNLLLMIVYGGEISLKEVGSFGSVFGSFFKPRGDFVLQLPCKNAKRPVLVSVEVGGDGGEIILVRRNEDGPTVCSSSSSPPHTVIKVSQTPPEQAAFFGGVEKGPGGGDPDGDDPDGDDPGSGGGSDGDEENVGGDGKRFPRDELSKLAKISILITAQTMTSLVTFSKEEVSTPIKYVLYFAVGMDICSYVFCLLAIWFRKSNPLPAAIMAAMGTSSAGIGFLLTMCLIVPANFLWVVAVASLVLLSSLAILLIS